MSKILLVEDNPMLIEIYRDLLEGDGFVTDIATDGRLALRLIQTGDYSLVYLDIMLPEVNGIYILQRIDISIKKRTKIVILTNLNQPNLIRDAKEHGAYDFKIKANTPPEEILRLTREYLSGETEL